MARVEASRLDGSEYLRRCSSLTDQPQLVDELVELSISQTAKSLPVQLEYVTELR